MPNPEVDLGRSGDIIIVPGTDDDENDAVNNFVNKSAAKSTFNHRLPDGSIVNIDPLADIVKFK